MNEDDSKKPYIYAEAACNAKASFCDLEACMKKEMETTNMCGVHHINQGKRKDFYGIEPQDAKAYKNKNIYECCPKGYTCSMPDSEIPEFLESHKTKKRSDSLLFSNCLFKLSFSFPSP